MLVIRSTTITSSLLAVALALPVPLSLAAQQPKPCGVNEGSPSEVARAFLAISQVATAQPSDSLANKKKLADAVGLLASGNLGDNPVGHAYEMGKLMMLWTMQPSQPLNYDARRPRLREQSTGRRERSGDHGFDVQDRGEGKSRVHGGHRAVAQPEALE